MTFETHEETFPELGISPQITVSPMRRREGGRDAKKNKQAKA